MGAIVARAPNGQAIRASRRTSKAQTRLRGFIKGAEKRDDLKEWRRGRAVLGYIQGKSVIVMAGELGVVRASINRWLQWYDNAGICGLRTRRPPGREPRLDKKQQRKLVKVIEKGPQAAGFETGIWTGPMVAEVIRRQFGVRYHNQHVPRLLHRLGFSVQRPRKRLARADSEAQDYWLRHRLPSIKKKPPPVEG